MGASLVHVAASSRAAVSRNTDLFPIAKFDRWPIRETDGRANPPKATNRPQSADTPDPF
jgi:hypothetical protein